MKSLRVIVCFAVVLVLLGFLVGQALAERPQTREIKDKVMWGDPDTPVESRDLSDGRQYQVAAPPEFTNDGYGVFYGKHPCRDAWLDGPVLNMLGVRHRIEATLLWRAGAWFVPPRSGK